MHGFKRVKSGWSDPAGQIDNKFRIINVRQQITE